MNNKFMKFTGTAALLAAAVAVAVAAAPGDHPSLNLPVTQLQYSPAGVRDGVPSKIQFAPAFGNPSTGAHGTFAKMPAGFVSPIHTHTEDYYAVVISGVGVNIVPGGTDVPLPPGSYWFQKGGERHITKCISTNECVFFINSQGKYDYIPDAPKN